MGHHFLTLISAPQCLQPHSNLTLSLLPRHFTVRGRASVPADVYDCSVVPFRKLSDRLSVLLIQVRS